MRSCRGRVVRCALPVTVTLPVRVSPVITCRRTLELLGCGWLWAAPGGCWRRVPVLVAPGLPLKGCSRFPHRGSPLSVAYWPTRRIDPHGMVPIRGEVSPWAWWSKPHGRNRRVGEQAMVAVVIDPLWRSGHTR